MPYLKSDKGTHSLALTLTGRHSNSAVKLSSEKMYTTYRITITDISPSYFADFPVSGNGKDIKSLKYAMKGKNAVLTLTTAEPLFIEKKNDSRHVFFDFRDPKDYFDKTVVIDAGAGGEDNGTTAEGIKEKDLTLSIIKKFKHQTDKKSVKEVKGYGNTLTSMKVDGVGTVGFFYTRLSDKTVTLKDRIEFAKTFDADLLLSVHMNSTASGRESSISGAQVLYRAADRTGESKHFADRIMSELKDHLGCGDRGVIAGDENYMISSAEMPVAIAEIGFITNGSERKKLTDDDYQQKAAEALLDAIKEEL